MLWKNNQAKKNANSSGKILALAADYTQKLDTNYHDLRLSTELALRETLLPLPSAQEEVKTLANQFDGLFLFGTDASEKILKANAEDYSILHLAVHGILNKNRPVLSSLALTEDSDDTENNFWQAHEISKMDLNADLVVLSAM